MITAHGIAEFKRVWHSSAFLITHFLSSALQSPTLSISSFFIEALDFIS